jgi:catechol 2,3-dioxygenase-like lactoylglutathione lyase family enzyme
VTPARALAETADSETTLDFPLGARKSEAEHRRVLSVAVRLKSSSISLTLRRCRGSAWTAPYVESGVLTNGAEMSGTEPVQAGEFRLEVVVVPVSDVDRAKDFYGSLGWRLDADLTKDDNYRVVQFTPPGSTCSIIFGKGLTDATPGSFEGLQLTVYDIDKARADLLERGVEVSESFHDVTGVFHHSGTNGRVDGPAPEHADYGSFAAFSDPDGNGWLLQEIKTRLPGR